MITSKCKKHPKYQAKRQPKDCAVCWAIWRKTHGIAGREPASSSLRGAEKESR
jgi:hypothetical protein